ncbi:autotransporter outer membrane beta-barrel domain-containing protein, partial [Deltaproteobacteria bacterium OttesenSCG-928-M10]|nr:autotransporter outer membrane beta-barrel domain-containing protein [Deltaproteobacteria bacterium OttesenSCG-928-M10]
ASLLAGTGGDIGALTMATGSILRLSNSGAGALNVNGNATFNSGILKQAHLSGSWRAGQVYEMLKIVTGTGAGDPNVIGRVGNNTTQGNLYWGDGIDTSENTLYFNPLAINDFTIYAFTPNQLSTAWALGTLDPNSPLYDYFNNILLPGQVPNALGQASGAGHSTMLSGLQIGAGSLGHLSLDRFSQKNAETDEFQYPRQTVSRKLTADSAGDYAAAKRLWFSLGGQWSEVDGEGLNTARAQWKGPEATLGYDYQTPDGLLLGGAFQFAAQDYEEDGGRHEADIDRLSLAVYGGKALNFNGGRLRLTGGASFSHYEIDSTRNIVLPAMFERLTADYDATAWNLFAEAAWGFAPTESLWLEPFLGLSYTHLSVDDFAETGGLFALRGQTDDADTLATTLGARASWQASERVSLNGKLAWEHVFGDRTPESDFAFNGSQYFRIQGAPLAQDSALLGLGLTAEINDRAAFALSYDGAFGSDSQRHSGTATLNITW